MSDVLRAADALADAAEALRDGSSSNRRANLTVALDAYRAARDAAGVGAATGDARCHRRDHWGRTFETEADAQRAADRWLRRGMTDVYVERHDVTTTRTVSTTTPEPQAAEPRSWSLPAPPPDDVTAVHVGGVRFDRDLDMWRDSVSGEALRWGELLNTGTVVEGQ